MASRNIEIHDSELKTVTVTDGNVVLELSPAYIHMSDGRPGIDAGTGWLQNAVIRVRGGELVGSINELPCTLWDGHLTVSDESFDNLVPILWTLPEISRLNSLQDPERHFGFAAIASR